MDDVDTRADLAVDDGRSKAADVDTYIAVDDGQSITAAAAKNIAVGGEWERGGCIAAE